MADDKEKQQPDDQQGAPADFGAPLTLATVTTRNAQVREQQQKFGAWRLACEVAEQDKCTVTADLLAAGPR